MTYFNPPFALNVQSNIGKEFLDLVRKFPKNNILSKIVNTYNIKLSYSTTKNMENQVALHNNRILQTEDDRLPPPRCNCRAALKPDCPMPNYCTAQCVVYRALVTSGDRDLPQQTDTYTGLTQNPIKKRIKKHYSDIAKFSPDDPDEHKSGTRLSRHCGQLGLDGIPYTIEWSILCETGYKVFRSIFLIPKRLFFEPRTNLGFWSQEW